MASTPPLHQLLLVVLVCAVSCCLPLHALDAKCAVYLRNWQARPERTAVVLPILGNTAHNSTICRWTFEQVELSYINWRVCYQLSADRVHTCPQHCLRDAADATVYGSFPYSANSSVCLSAIHAGLLSSPAGGAVILERFYPADWSGTATQSIFPLGSHVGSHSNGVQSEEVPEEWRPLPSPLLSHSFTVRSRGAVASQRQTAPFSARSGHSHVFFTHLSSDRRHYQHHLIIGGRNATHYMVSEPHPSLAIMAASALLCCRSTQLMRCCCL